MPWKVSDLTETFTVTDPESGEEASVTIRRMSEGDRLAMAAAIRSMPDDIGIAEYAVEMRRWRIEHCVTSWTVPFPVSEAFDLDPRLIESIDERIQLHNPGIFPKALSSSDKAMKAEVLANTVESFLDGDTPEDGLRDALASYRGDDADRPTEAP